MNRAITLLACAILTACGGGGSDAPEPTPIVAAAPKTLQLFGDSTMRVISGQLIARYGAGRVENRARDGTSSTQLIAGTDTVNLPWPQSTTATYAVVNHGLNDGYRSAAIPLDQYRTNLETLAAAPRTTMIFQTPLPSTAIGRDMTAYAQVMREVADKHGLRLIDVFECFQRQPDWRARFKDGTHPDAAGLAAMVECMAPVLDEVML